MSPMATRAALPKVQLTKVFRAALEAEDSDPDILAEAFSKWKQDWPKFRDAEYYFGKDGYYRTPMRNGKPVVMHVHMPPETPDPRLVPSLAKQAKILAEIQKWDEKCEQRRHAHYRTSSRVLVYVDGGRHGYLLLHLAREPDGHDETTANKRLMNEMADVAEAFIHNGTILI